MPLKNSAPDPLLAALQHALLHRDIRTGFALLDRAFPAASALTPMPVPTRPIGIALLLSLAQWTDLGYRDLTFLDAAFAALTPVDLPSLPLADYLQLRMAQAFSHLAREQPQPAIDSLDLVLRLEPALLGSYHLFLAHFWKGRAHRKRGDYEEAALHIAAARAAAEQAHAPKLVAVTKIHESWLAFQSGKRPYAFTLLDEAETALASTGHALSLGNIASARGRFVRRSGEYALALTHFESAIAIYRAGCPHHPNLARALVNAAYVKRLIALDLRAHNAHGHAKGATHARSLAIFREALALLDQAGELYARHHHQGGTGSVLVIAANLHLESGDIDRASTESQRAYTLGQEQHDQILMARARVLQSSVALAIAEEQLGDQPDIALHAHRAIQYAEDAIELALHTQNKRLLAAAYIARGTAAASDFHQQWDAAKQHQALAAALLGHDDRDHLYKQLCDLKARLVGATHIDETLRLWSTGQLGNKTFQQVQEEFAELVIPKIWLQHGRNVTLVAKTLSISPKKVRRILRNARLQPPTTP